MCFSSERLTLKGQNDIIICASDRRKDVINWVWRSLVARLNGVQEVASSNLVTQTIAEAKVFASVFF